MDHRALSLVFVALLATPLFAAIDLPASWAVVGGEFTYSVRKGDSLSSLSARFGVPEKVLARDNALTAPYRLKAGMGLKVYNAHLVPTHLDEGILINIPQRMLFLFRDGKVAGAYPVALGRRDWKTPAGSFYVAQRETKKTWIVPPSIQEEMRRSGKPVLTRVLPGPDNPLGEHWIALSIPGYGIHGTNAPSSIYRMRTHGCIRLHPDDARALYEQVSAGTPVEIVYAPVMLFALPGGPILVEFNPDVYNRGVEPVRMLRDLARRHALEADIDWTRAAALARAQDGLAREAGRTPGTEAVDSGRTVAGRGPRSEAVYDMQQLAGARGACAADGAR